MTVPLNAGVSKQTEDKNLVNEIAMFLLSSSYFKWNFSQDVIFFVTFLISFTIKCVEVPLIVAGTLT